MAEFESSITAYFGGDTSGLNKAAGEASQTLDKLGNKVGDKLLGMRDMSTAIATALGINIEKISENIAGLVTSMTEESKEAYKKIGELSTQVADQNIAAMHRQTSLQNQLTLAVQEQTKVQEKINQLHETETNLLEKHSVLYNTLIPNAIKILELYIKREAASKTVVDLAEKEQELVKSNAETERVRAELKGKELEIGKQVADYNKNERQHAASILGYNAQVAALQENILAYKKALAAAEEKTVDQGNKVLEVQKARFALEDLILKHKQQIAGSAAEELEYLTLTAKVTQGLASGPEELRLQIIKKQREERAVMLEMTDLENKSIAGKLTDADKARLAELIKQHKKLTEQLTTLEQQETQLKLNSEIAVLQAKVLAGTINPAEQDRLNLLIAQGKALAGQVADSDKVVENLMKVANIYGKTDENLSDRELAEKLGNLKKQLQGAQDANDTGAYFFATKIKELEFEIGRRASFRSDYQMKGEKAFLDFSAFDESTLRNYIRPEDQALANKSQNAIIELNQNFKDLLKKR